MSAEGIGDFCNNEAPADNETGSNDLESKLPHPGRVEKVVIHTKDKHDAHTGKNGK